ncbi:MAG: hypothetical protein ACRDZX_16480 [Acidimicrobiales bacterium]
MPTLEEDMIRTLLQRCTEDLHAPPLTSLPRRISARTSHWRQTALGAAAAVGVAAAVVIGISPSTSSNPSVHLSPGTAGTAAVPGHTALEELASASLTAPPPQGRYAVMTETQDNYSKTSVIDSITGDAWTYQQGNGVPSELPVALHFSKTATEFAKMPTDPTALRAALISQAEAEGAGEEATGPPARAGAGSWPVTMQKAPVTTQNAAVGQTTDGEVFQQATDMLWNPLVPPALRSALYKVLAGTPGAQVNTNVHDGAGRPAVEISRVSSGGSTEATFESPSTGAVLETMFESSNPATGQITPSGMDLYLSTTWSNSVPANPYSS